MQGTHDGPTLGSGGECFAWSYANDVGGSTVGAAAPIASHSYAYVEKGQLIDYSASDGKYKLWSLAKPPRPGCPGVAWPPAASGTLAVTKHALAALPSGVADAFALLDYDPANGDYRLGACNRSVSNLAGHLDCKTTSNGTWHTGGLQLLWVGGQTLMRYSKATGQFSLWAYTAAKASGLVASGAAFDASPIVEGALLKSDGQRLRGATLTYLDAGELLALNPSTGHVSLYRRTTVPATVGAERWSLSPETEEGFVPPVDGFTLRWESGSVLRGWQATYVGAQTLMLLKPASGSYRILNCSAIYAPGNALPAAAAAAGLAGGPPCALLVEGGLPEHAPCNHTREHCLLAPHCGWCESASQCVAANEDGVCFGNCPDGQLLYSTNAWQPELVEGGPPLLLEQSAREQSMLASQVR